MPGFEEQLRQFVQVIGQDLSMLPLRGVGRPDKPNTTNGVITGNEPNGTQYMSTDGANVGAWLWQKRNGRWVVTDGDTGWCRIDSPALREGYLMLRRTAVANYVCGAGGRWGTVSLNNNLSGNLIKLLEYGLLPEGWRTPIPIISKITHDGYTDAGNFMISSRDDANYICIRSPTQQKSELRLPMLVYPPSDPWCNSLPGTQINL